MNDIRSRECADSSDKIKALDYDHGRQQARIIELNQIIDQKNVEVRVQENNVHDKDNDLIRQRDVYSRTMAEKEDLNRRLEGQI
jgi:hypothetical protein